MKQRIILLMSGEKNQHWLGWKWSAIRHKVSLLKVQLLQKIADVARATMPVGQGGLSTKLGWQSWQCYQSPISVNSMCNINIQKMWSFSYAPIIVILTTKDLWAVKHLFLLILSATQLFEEFIYSTIIWVLVYYYLEYLIKCDGSCINQQHLQGMN